MATYSFADLRLNLTTHDQPALIVDTFEAMFLRAPKDEPGGHPVQVKTFTIEEPFPCEHLPGWLGEAIPKLPVSMEAHMLYGPEGDVATVAVHEASTECAWLSSSMEEIRFVVSYAPNTPELAHSVPVKDQKVGLPAGLSVTGVLVAILREALLRKGKILLHAAAVRCSDGTGVLIQADGGGGKSTTALSMVRQGASMLADDLIALDGDNAHPHQMTGFREDMNLTEQTLAFFPELGSISDWPGPPPPPPDWPIKLNFKARVNPEKVFPHAYSSASVPLQAIYFVSISDQGPGARRLPPHETLGRLIKSHTFALGQKLDPALGRQIIDLTYSVPAYIIETGTNPGELGAWLNAHSHNLAAPEAHTGGKPC